MYMPLMVDIKRAVVFAGERGEGLQKIQKLAVYADELLCVPEGPRFPPFIELSAGVQPLTEPTMRLTMPRRVPVAQEPASLSNFRRYIAGANFVSSDLKDRRLNEAISSYCAENGVLCNIIDTKDLCNTWFMSLINEPFLQVAVSSQGGCAFYSAQTRRELEPQIAWRSRVSEILTALRLEVREPENRLAVLETIYADQDFQKAIQAGLWERAHWRGREVKDAWESSHETDEQRRNE